MAALISLGAAAAIALESEQPAEAPAQAEVAPVAPVPVAPPVFAPPADVVVDNSLFRRTPLIDGVVEDGEWDVFYTISSGGWEATVYVDWDASNLYIAAKSNKPVDLLAVLDANADGWFHGEDNYEFRTSGASSDAMTLAVSRYESRNTRTPAAAPVSTEEAMMVEIKSSRGTAGHMIEMCIPGRLIKGLRLVPDRKIGLGVSLNAGDSYSGWVPAAERGQTHECTLVTRKFAALKPLELGFDLRTDRVARGETLSGRFHLTNSSTELLDVRTFVIAGEGKGGDYLNSQRIRIEGIPGRKHISHDVQSLVPSDMRLGCWALGAEVRSGSERLGSALISFEVVEPFTVELKLPAGQIKPDVKDVTFSAVIRNNTRNRMTGTAKITLPPGWELWRNADKRDFTITVPDGIGTVAFKAKPPLGAEGIIPVTVEATVGSRTMTADGSITVAKP